MKPVWAPVLGKVAHGLRWGLLGVLLSGSAQAGIDKPTGAVAAVNYHIDRGALAAALQQWSRQSNQVVVFDAGELAGLESLGVTTPLPPRAALDRLVAGLPVTVLVSREGAVVVRRDAPAVSAARSQPRRHPPASPHPTHVDLAPVHVTGSRLPRTSVQTSMAVTVIDRDEIQRSGYGSLFDLLRHLPGMTGHSPLSTSAGGDSPYLPVGAAATTSLDGLGPRATLFLVNGRRLPRYPMVSLEHGALTDLGGIPLSFVERIELVRGGASAIYGADAMAGVVNILLREEADGVEATLQSGLSGRGDGGQQRLQLAGGGTRSDGDRWFAGLDLHQVRHVAGDRRTGRSGNEWYPIGLLGDDGQYLPAALCDAPLQRDADGCWFDGTRPRSLQPASVSAAAYGRYRRALGQGRHMYVEARGSQTRQRFALGPTAVALELDEGALINHVFNEAGAVRPRVRATDIDVSLGLGRDLPGRSWDAGFSVQRSDVTLTTRGAVHTRRLYAAADDGFLPGFSLLPASLAAELFPSIRNYGRTDQWQAWWGEQREVMALPGGAVQLASGIDLRHEAWAARPDPLLGDGELALGLPVAMRRLSRPSAALYAELGLPLTTAVRLDLAARWDRDAGEAAFSPRMGLRWDPSPQWSVLLSSGRGYRAPSLFERRRPPGYFEPVVALPSSTMPPCAYPSAQGCLLDVEVAENAGLKAETSRSHGLGVSWSPGDALSLSLAHTVVDLRNEILAQRPEDALWHPGIWELDADGALRAVRLSFDNIGRTVSRNWVLRGDYRPDTAGRGEWRVTLDALKQQALKYYRHGSDTTGRTDQPVPQLAAALTTQWEDNGWDIAVRANYLGGIRAWSSGDGHSAAQTWEGHRAPPAQVRWNVHVRMQLAPRLSVALDLHNLLDTRTVGHRIGHGGSGADDPLGRYVLLALQVH